MGSILKNLKVQLKSRYCAIFIVVINSWMLDTIAARYCSYTALSVVCMLVSISAFCAESRGIIGAIKIYEPHQDV